MKKLTTLQDFINNNPSVNSINSSMIFAGKSMTSGETNNYCFTLDDTCVNNRSDIHHVRERDGVILSDVTTMTE